MSIDFPRGEWLERKIGKTMNHMGFALTLPYPWIEDYRRAFLKLAHYQGRLLGVRDRSKVLNYFSILLQATRYCSVRKRARKMRAVTAELLAMCAAQKTF
jgi:hypothetical protein